MRVTPPSRASRILRKLRSFDGGGSKAPSPIGNVGGGVIGRLTSSSGSIVHLFEEGAQFEVAGTWRFVAYADISVRFPPKEPRGGPLTLGTPYGEVELLAGSQDAWEAGRFFMRCAEDASAA
jgi:hypothetical protein